CAYQSGKVSLSPTVTSTPYGSTESSRSAAMSRVARCLARDADVQLQKSGTSAIASTGDARFQPRRDGARSRRASPDVADSATSSHRCSNPTAAHTPQAEKLQMKK